MKNRTTSLLLLFFVVFGTYAVTRNALNLPADRRGYDAIDYVILHGNVQHDQPVSLVRPTDVTVHQRHRLGGRERAIATVRSFERAN